MKLLIIPEEIAIKLREMEFDGFNRIDPVKGEMDGKEVYFLQAEIYLKALYGLDKIFEKAIPLLEKCEVKEIETIEQKYYDKEIEIKDISKIDITELKTVIVLTENLKS